MKWAAAGVFLYCISGLPLQDGIGREAARATRLGRGPRPRGAPAGAGRVAAGLLARRELLTLRFHNKKVTHGVSTYPASSPVGVFEPK